MSSSEISDDDDDDIATAVARLSCGDVQAVLVQLGAGSSSDGSSSSIEFVHRAGLVRAVFSEPVDLLSRAHGWGMQL